MNTIMITVADVQDLEAPPLLQNFVGINCDSTRPMPSDPGARTPAEKIACAIMVLLTNTEWLAATTGVTPDGVTQATAPALHLH